MTDRKRQIIQDFNMLLCQNFSDNMKDLILFGSQAYDSSNAESDYDFLVVLKNKVDWKTERKISDLSYEIDLKYNIITDTHVLAESELDSLRGKQPIFFNAISTGIHV
jgi:predicted nucleotidyltransferase